MKMYTNSDQTSKLIELGFEEPKSKVLFEVGNDELGYAYSIGELIEVIPDTGSDNWRDRQIFGTTVYYYAEKSIYVCDENGELIDNLFDMVVLLKEGGVI